MKSYLPLLIALVATTAQAQVTKAGSAYLLRAKYVAGQKMSYTMSNNANVPGMQQGMKMTSPIVMTVKSVKNGIATIEVLTGPAVLNGRNQGDTDKRTVKLDSRNKAVGGESNFEGFSSFEYPSTAVKPGQSWNGKTKLDTPMGGIQLNAKYTFIGLKAVKGKQVAEIKSSFSGAMMGPIKGTATTYLLVSDGSLFGSTGQTKIEMKMSPEAKPTTITANVAVTRK